MADSLDGAINEVIADAQNFFNVLDGNAAAGGLTQDQLDELKTKTNLIITKISDQAASLTAYRTDTAERKAATADFKDLFRKLRQVVQAHPGTTDALRASLNLATGEGGAGGDDLFEIAPLLLVGQAGIHEHRVNFFMQGEDSDSTKKPKGADGAKIYLKIGGEPSTNLKEYQMIAFDRKQPYVWKHEPEDAGKTAHYIALWATDDDEESPQSEVFSLVIT